MYPHVAQEFCLINHPSQTVLYPYYFNHACCMSLTPWFIHTQLSVYHNLSIAINLSTEQEVVQLRNETNDIIWIEC